MTDNKRGSLAFELLVGVAGASIMLLAIATMPQLWQGWWKLILTKSISVPNFAPSALVSLLISSVVYAVGARITLAGPRVSPVVLLGVGAVAVANGVRLISITSDDHQDLPLCLFGGGWWSW